MALTSLITCDLHGEDAPKASSHTFSLDTRSYEIDLCEEHFAQIQEALSEFIEVARRSGTRTAVAGRGRGKVPAAPPTSIPAVREWARRNGMEVSAKGRIPSSVLHAYEASDSKDSDQGITVFDNEREEETVNTRGRSTHVTRPARGKKAAVAAKAQTPKTPSRRSGGAKASVNS